MNPNTPELSQPLQLAQSHNADNLRNLRSEQPLSSPSPRAKSPREKSAQNTLVRPQTSEAPTPKSNSLARSIAHASKVAASKATTPKAKLLARNGSSEVSRAPTPKDNETTRAPTTPKASSTPKATQKSKKMAPATAVSFDLNNLEEEADYNTDDGI
jgi:hypothetical protein